MSLVDDDINSAGSANRQDRRRPVGPRKTACRFVVIGSPRTGSSHLTALIGKHRDILFNSAIFHEKKVWVHWPKPDLTAETLAELAALRASDPDAFLERIFETNYGRSVVGFKMFSHHDKQAMAKILANPSIRKVVLYRRNVLSNYSSRLIARAIGEHTFKASDVRPERPLVHFDAADFIAFHDKYVGFYRYVVDTLVASGQTFHPLSYEEINDLGFLSNLILYLGANPKAAKFESAVVKQNPSDIASRFSNRADVEQFCRTSGFAHWLEEGETQFHPWSTPARGN